MGTKHEVKILKKTVDEFTKGKPKKINLSHCSIWELIHETRQERYERLCRSNVGRNNEHLIYDMCFNHGEFDYGWQIFGWGSEEEMVKVRESSRSTWDKS